PPTDAVLYYNDGDHSKSHPLNLRSREYCVPGRSKRSNPMAQESQSGALSSPENQDDAVRQELDQEFITHQGDYRTSKTPAGANQRGKHLGATDDEVVPVTPPMAGPADLVGERNPNAQG